MRSTDRLAERSANRAGEQLIGPCRPDLYAPHGQTRTRPSTRRRHRKPPLTSRTADPYDLYQRSVQNVEHEIDFVDRVFLKHRARRAATLREDFCGTANTACEWVRRRRSNIAVGLDLDPKPLAWGRKHNL